MNARRDQGQVRRPGGLVKDWDGRELCESWTYAEEYRGHRIKVITGADGVQFGYIDEERASTGNSLGDCRYLLHLKQQPWWVRLGHGLVGTEYLSCRYSPRLVQVSLKGLFEGSGGRLSTRSRGAATARSRAGAARSTST